MTRALGRSSSVGLALATLLLAQLAPRAALAQAGKPKERPAEPAPKSKDEEAYSQHMANGVRLFNSKDWRTAITEFEAAYRAIAKPGPLINQALCYRELAIYPKVVDRLELALRDHEAALSSDEQAAAKRALEEARALLAYVTVTITPADAKLTVDGEPTAIEHQPIALGPGEHELSASAPGHVSVTKKVAVVSSDRLTIELVLVKAAGSLRITAAKATTAIEVDGAVRGYGSFQGDFPSGPHTVRLVGETGTGSIEVETGKLLAVDASKGLLPALPAEKAAPAKPAADAPKRGFFGHVNGAVLFPAYHPKRFAAIDSSPSSGGTFGGRAGYRVHTYAAFEGLAEYGNVEGPANGAGDATYSLSSIRLGPTLRLMSPGDTIRFVGTVGGGLAVDIMSYEDLRADKQDPLCPGAAERCSTNGLDFFVLTEAGAEVDFDGVLIGLSVAAYFSSTKGMNDEVFGAEKASVNVEKPYENRILPMVGPRAHIGYAFW